MQHISIMRFYRSNKMHSVIYTGKETLCWKDIKRAKTRVWI